MYNNKRPVRTAADMKGLRIRVQQSEAPLYGKAMRDPVAAALIERIRKVE